MVTAVVLLTGGCILWAETKSPQQSMSEYAELVLSPDASQIAVVETVHPAEAAAALHNTISIYDTSGRKLGAFDPCPDCTYTSPGWSPNGRTLAFLAIADTQSSIFEVEGGQVRKIAQVSGSACKMKWSAEGSSLAFLLASHAHDGGHKVGNYRRVGVMVVPHDTQRITLLPARGGDTQPVSPDGLWVYDFDWRPNGMGFVAVAAEGDADNQWYQARLVTLSPTGSVHDISLPTMQIARPRVSPDGKKVAFIGGLMSDEVIEGGDVFVTDLATNATENVTPGFGGTINSVSWSGPGLIAGITWHGSTGTARVDPVRHQVSEINVRPETVSAREGRVSVSADGKSVAYVAESFNSPAHLVFGAPGVARPITPSVGTTTGQQVSIQDVRWHSDGREIQGWLLMPRGAAPVRTLIVTVHGGPSYATTPFFVGSRMSNGDMTGDMLRAGYAVFAPNVRGSFGEGEDYVRANVNDMGDGPLKDVLSGVDEVERMLSIGDRAVGLFGWSYAGFFTMWAATHTQRFAAIVSGAGMADWTSYYSQTVIPAWVDLFLGGPPYTHMTNYDRASPIRYLQYARTPTLLENGENDSGAPPEQAEAFWKGLLFYKVPTKLVLYPGEAHRFHDPTNIRQRSADTIGWFDQWLAK